MQPRQTYRKDAMGRRAGHGWLAIAALALAAALWAPASAQVVARADMLGGKLVPASSDPSADIASARAIDLAVTQAAGSRNPRCLTPAEAAQLDELARLLDAVRTYIDTQERGWTGSGFPTHADIPDHGAPTTAEVALDGLKSAYWVLRNDFERLSRLPPCTPPPPGAGVMPGPPPGTSQPPQPPERGGAATPGTGTGQVQPGGEGGGGVGPPEPPEDAPPPPATSCRTPDDDAYIAQETQHLDELMTDRDAKYTALQFREMELAAAQNPASSRFAGRSPAQVQQQIEEDQREIEQEQQAIAADDAAIFAVRANLAAEKAKPPCGEGKAGSAGQGGGSGGVIGGGGEGGGGDGGGGGSGNPFTPPPLPTPPPGACRTPADDAYEAAVEAILDQARRDRAADYAELAPLLVEQYQIQDQIDAANGDGAEQARLKAAYSGRLQSLDQSINQLQLKIEALDAAINAAETRLKHRKAPCRDGQSSMAVPPPASEGQTAAAPQDDGPVLGGLGVRVQKSRGPNRAAGEEGSGEEGGGQAPQTPSQQPQTTRPGD